MYLLDTNVVSELRKSQANKNDKNVAVWFIGVPTVELYLSVITILEIELGVMLKEKKDPVQGKILRTWLNDHVLPSFKDRILPVDLAVAQCCAKLHVPDPRPERDALLAATAHVHQMIVVTRDEKDFKPMGVEFFNPWN